MGVPAVIRAAARFDGVRTAGAGGGLRLQVRSPQNSVQPRLPAPLAPRDLWASPVDHYLDVVGTDGGQRKSCGDISLHPQPLVEEIGDRSLYADAVRIENGRVEANQSKAETELPAVIVAPAVNKTGFGRCHGWVSRGGLRQQGGV